MQQFKQNTIICAVPNISGTGFAMISRRPSDYNGANEMRVSETVFRQGEPR